MHKSTNEKVSKGRERKIKEHNKKMNIISQRFSLDDFLLIREAQNKGNKLSHRWIGPRRITKIQGELVYEVENMVTGKFESVHSSRIRLYRSSAEGTEVSKELMAHIEASEAKYEIVDKFIKLSNSGGEFYIQTMWLGNYRSYTKICLIEFQSFYRNTRTKNHSKKLQNPSGLRFRDLTA